MMSEDTTLKVDVQVATGAQPNVVWDDSKMHTSFANVVNAVSSREEVTLFFGTNQTWNPGSSGELKVELSNRIILTPHAAKRLWLLMGGLLKEYEQRNGTLEIATRARDRSAQ
jgi:hypothetical protein